MFDLDGLWSSRKCIHGVFFLFMVMSNDLCRFDSYSHIILHDLFKYEFLLFVTQKREE